MPVVYPGYKPGFLLRNGHLHTIMAYFLRSPVRLPYTRSVIETPDGDFLALDFIFSNGSQKCALLIHGLEGSAESAYIITLAISLQSKGWDVAALNLRGCSGTDNRLYNAYHSGIYEDLDVVVDLLRKKYTSITVTGFSLGGNIVLKYIGQLGNENSDKVKAAAAVSVPCHLSSSSDRLEQWDNYIYNQRFVNALKKKLKKKMELFPDKISQEDFDNLRTIRQIDDHYTGPANGFTGAEDYYTKCSSLYTLPQIRIPTLLINALDDPFLTTACMPFEEAEKNQHLFFYASRYGGHVGFLPEKKGREAQHEIWISAFFDCYSP